MLGIVKGQKTGKQKKQVFERAEGTKSNNFDFVDQNQNQKSNNKHSNWVQSFNCIDKTAGEVNNPPQDW